MAARWIIGAALAVTLVTTGSPTSAWAAAVLLDRVEIWDGATLPVGDPSAVARGPGGRLVYVAENPREGNSATHNLWEIDLAGHRVVKALDLRSFTREPAGLTYDERRGTLFVTDDDQRELHEVDLDGRRLRTIDLGQFGARDPEGLSSDGERLYVADGRGQQVLVLSMEGALLRSFSFEEHGFRNAEGIAYDPQTQHLYLVEGEQDTLFELDAEGALVGAYDLGVLGIEAPEGVSLAEPGRPNPAAAGPRLLIADELVHDQADGRIVEIELVRRPEKTRTVTSWVGDPDGFGFLGGEPGFARADADHDGRLEVGERLPAPALLSEPRLDMRELDDDPATDVLQMITETAPLTLTHELTLGEASPLWARLSLRVADARALALSRNLIRVDGVLIGEVVGARGRNLASGAILQTDIELPPAALEKLADGRARIEISRPPGTGSDDVWIDYSLLEVAVAR